MPKISFSGEVLPISHRLSLRDRPVIHWERPTLNLTYDLRLVVQEGKFTIDVDLSRDITESDASYVYVTAYDMVKGAIDLVNFAEGMSFSVAFMTFTDSAGVTREWIIRNKNLAQFCTAFRITDNATFDAALRLFLITNNMNWALRDLIAAFTLPHHATTNCGRVIESIRRNVANEPAGNDSRVRARAWETMQASLHIDESYIKFITEKSVGGRHADRSHISGEITKEIVERSWKIMDRFIHFKLGGDQPLDPTTFPLLV